MLTVIQGPRGSGKSTVAKNLAIAFERFGTGVVYIECYNPEDKTGYVMYETLHYTLSDAAGGEEYFKVLTNKIDFYREKHDITKVNFRNFTSAIVVLDHRYSELDVDWSVFSAKKPDFIYSFDNSWFIEKMENQQRKWSEEKARLTNTE